jgi:hypothetical protein
LTWNKWFRLSILGAISKYTTIDKITYKDHCLNNCLYLYCYYCSKVGSVRWYFNRVAYSSSMFIWNSSKLFKEKCCRYLTSTTTCRAFKCLKSSGRYAGSGAAAVVSAQIPTQALDQIHIYLTYTFTKFKIIHPCNILSYWTSQHKPTNLFM